MQAQVIGNTVDECILKSIEKLKKNCLYIESPVSVCLKNPLARFSLIPSVNPVVGVIFGICTLAGINSDSLVDFLSEYRIGGLDCTMQGPLFRGYKVGNYKAIVTLKNAVGFADTEGKIDQLENVVENLKIHKRVKMILYDPSSNSYQWAMPDLVNFFIIQGNLSVTVHLDSLEMFERFPCYIVPVFSFIQQIVASLVGVGIGELIVVADSMQACNCSEHEVDELYSFLKVFRKIPQIKKDCYKDSNTYDLRYIDNALRYLADFGHRVQEGDLMVNNPFSKGISSIKVFYDYAEVLRSTKAKEQGLKVDGASTFLHPHLAYYYDI